MRRSIPLHTFTLPTANNCTPRKLTWSLTSFSTVGTEARNRLDLPLKPRIGVGVGRRMRTKTDGSGLASRNAGLWVVGAPIAGLRA
jgi:hypothetical protein